MPSATAPAPSPSSSPPCSPEPAQDGGFAVYVHWPFCRSKCPYCDFNSHVRADVDEAAFRDGLVQELRAAARLTRPRPVDSLFFGGGTPSLMAPATVGAVIDAVTAIWGWAGAPGTAPEITLEANPTSVEADRFAGYRAAGVNRVSLGVQALNDDALRRLGRTHSAAEALGALDVARARFDRASIDLIYARPDQTPDAWAAELDRALALGTEHLSLYQLTIEPDTPFAALHARGRLKTPDDDAAADLYDLTQARCAAAGLPAYEVSNHARPGAESRHNLVYWRQGAWVGVGPGAHGRLDAADGRRLAVESPRSPDAWLRAIAAEGTAQQVTETIAPAAQADELLLMGLRLREGVSLHRLARLRGRPLAAARLAALTDDGLAVVDGDRLAATEAGRRVLNAMIAWLAD